MAAISRARSGVGQRAEHILLLTGGRADVHQDDPGLVVAELLAPDGTQRGLGGVVEQQGVGTGCTSGTQV
jgi:hypothetical protein